MSKWIELHDPEIGTEILVKKNEINSVFTIKNSDDTFEVHISLMDGTEFVVKEKYEDIKPMVTNE